MPEYLHTRNSKIVDSKLNEIYLRGVNFGGWLMMEAYFTHAPNYAEHIFKNHFREVLGTEALAEFENSYRKVFIGEQDFANVSKLGFNCVRLPFNYRLLDQGSGKLDSQGVTYLDQALKWAKEYKIWIILDLHAAPGAQNHDWHSDSDGRALLWKSAEFQQRTLDVWEFIADRYKNAEFLAGYDLLNEAVTEDTGALNKLYKKIVKTIRKIDKNHILFIEGNKWAQDLDCLNQIEDDNYVFSIHFYEPLNFTFNFLPQLKYPLKTKESNWNKSVTRKLLEKYYKISQREKAPIHVGEFGVNVRGGVYGEDVWLADTLKVFKDFNFHWNYWTYKAVKNYTFPDGLYSFYENPPWVNRAGPRQGWDTYSIHWPEFKKEMVDSWKTERFQLNNYLLKVLQQYAV